MIFLKKLQSNPYRLVFYDRVRYKVKLGLFAARLEPGLTSLKPGSPTTLCEVYGLCFIRIEN